MMRFLTQLLFFHSNSSTVTGDWSSDGCTAASVNGDIVTCSCNHLTHFAILLSPGIEASYMASVCLD